MRIYGLLSLAMCVFQFGCNKPDKTSSPNYDSLSLVLEEVFITDQVVRGGSVTDSENSISRLYDYKIDIVDSINMNAVSTIVEKYGLPPKDSISRKAIAGMFLVVQHSSKDTLEKYFELFKSKYPMNSDLAVMEDRFLMYNGEKQKYGSQAVSFLSHDHTMTIWPIENTDSVNFLRQGLFLHTVEENAERAGYQYNPCQELPSKELIEKYFGE